MNYKKNSPKPTLFSFIFLCFSFYLLTQLRIEYLETRSKINSWQTLKTATNTVALHGISVLSAGMINIGTQLNRMKNKLNKDELTNTKMQEQIQTIATQDSTPSLILPKEMHKKNEILHSEEIHKKLFEQQIHTMDSSSEQTHIITNQNSKQNEIENEYIQKIPEQIIKTQEQSSLDSSYFSYVNTLEDQLTSAQKYILREEAKDYSDHTINILSEEIKSLKSYANYIETEYGNEQHKETFQKKLLTLVNKSEQLLTSITEELTGTDQLFQPSSTIEQGIEHNKTILAQLRTQLS